MIRLTNGKYDSITAILLLILTGLSYFLPFNTYPEWRYWTFSYTPIVLLGFTIGFAISSARQPGKFDKYTGTGILILIVLIRSVTPSISA